VGLLSGSYPAVALSSYKPVDVLKGKIKSGSKGRTLRNVLVVSQFVISLVLIIGTLIVYSQLDYMQHKDIGLDKEQIVIIKNGANLRNQQETFRDELMKLPGIVSASLTTNYPTQADFTDFYHPQNTKGNDVVISSVLTDHYFMNTMGIDLIKGRNFRKYGSSDSRSIIINKKTADSFGWTPQEAIGKIIVYPGGDYQKFKVIGVMKNFNYYSLLNPVPNFAFFHRSSHSYDVDKAYLAVKISPKNITQTLASISSKWKKFKADVPFEYEFLNDRFDALYRSQEQMGVVFGVFTIIAIIVACMGLLGLVTFATEQRTKEIGIRKVLGASSGSIILMLTKDFAKLTGIAFLIACPIAYYLMQQWLQDFANRIEIGPGIFLISGFATMFIVLTTISWQSLKAALMNPVNSLRSE
jgi:putative ABC transport system permease protein